ncbi:sialidase family protein [Sporosarcina sp. SAFN-015]|uniref:sialidase family protein n=1 Tax=Sporosarcina sp. SAFN-015 TaxID=3387274 RepID=UPI003F7E1B92
MTKYTPIDWKDEIVDANGNVVQKGTPLSAENLRRIDDGIVAVATQLADTAPQLKNAPYIYQAMGMAFDSNDPTLVDHDTHASWPYSNVHWDAKINKVVVFYTIKPTHALTNVRLMMRHMDVNYNFTEPKVIADGRKENLALRSQGSCILPNGDYCVFVSRMDNTTQVQLGCDMYISSDSGKTWTIREIGLYGNPIKGQWGDINGAIVTKTGRIITYLCEYQTTIARFLYSDDNGVNWYWSEWEGGSTYYNYSEPAFLQLSNGTIICYLRPNSGGQPLDAIPEKAIFTKSTDGGLTWSKPIQSKSITDFTQGNGQLLLDKEAGRVEFLYYSRHKKLDDMSSIYQSIASESDAENDNFGEPNRIIRFNRTDSYDGKIGDGGYVGACYLPDKRVVGFYYTGDKVKANICYFVGKKGTKENIDYTIEERYGTVTKFSKENDVNKKLEAVDIFKENLLPLDSASWDQGALWGVVGGKENPQPLPNRIRLKGGLSIKGNTSYSLTNLNTAYRVSIRQYDKDGFIIAITGWVDTLTFKTEPNAVRLGFLISKSNDSDLTPADITNANIIFSSIDIEEKIKSIKLDINNLYASKENIVPLNQRWEQGSFGGGGVGQTETLVDAANRIRTGGFIQVIGSTNYELTFTNPSYQVGLRQYDKNNVLVSDSGWQSTNYQFVTNKNAVRIKLVVRKADNSNLVPSESSSFNLSIKGATPYSLKPTFIFDEGREKKWITGGWVEGTAVGAGTATKNTDSLQASFNLGDGVAGKQGFITASPIDITNISEIYATAVISNITGSAKANITIYNKSNPTSSSDGRLAYIEYGNVGINNMVIDVSALSGNVYIAVGGGKPLSGSGQVDVKFYEIWY